jgi:hypothetical protein
MKYLLIAVLALGFGCKQGASPKAGIEKQPAPTVTPGLYDPATVNQQMYGTSPAPYRDDYDIYPPPSPSPYNNYPDICSQCITQLRMQAQYASISYNFTICIQRQPLQPDSCVIGAALNTAQPVSVPCSCSCAGMSAGGMIIPSMFTPVMMGMVGSCR